MEYKLKNFEPSRFFHYFEEISAIPRASLKEELIADYLVNFAAERGLFCVRDEARNVFVRLPASEGREGEPAILLQGHTDMVCEKNAGTVHDFDTQGIDLVVEGDVLSANGTTLGADDGFAVALMLAILDGECPSHPTVECLFTSGEEIGLIGAGAFDYSLITARRLINMDSAEEGCITVGCAGGVRSDVTLSASREETPDTLSAVSISVSGLFGGHSGEDINKGRASAITLLGTLLKALGEVLPFRIVSVSGGTKDNAIAREAEAVVCVADADAAKTALLGAWEGIRATLSESDSGAKISVSAVEVAPSFSEEFSDRVLKVWCGVKVGVMKMSEAIEGLVEYSRNLGILSTSENGVSFTWSTRSPNEPQLDEGEKNISAIAESAGATECRHYSRYPGWSYPGESALADEFDKAYRSVCDKETGRIILHAGLECGIIKGAIPDMDIISIGPDTYDLHSPDERMIISSASRICETVKKIIAG